MDAATLSRFWPSFILVSTPFIAQGLKRLAPVWEKEIGEHYVYVVMAIGIVLNLAGYSFKPEDFLQSQDLVQASIDVTSTTLQGAGIGFGSSKLYDIHKKATSPPIVPTVCKPRRRRKAARRRKTQ